MPENTANLLPDVNLSAPTRAGHAEVVELRREFHKMPEIGLEEYKTADLIEQKLKTLGIDSKRVTETGLSAMIDTGAEGPTLMLRADIDALPVTEEAAHDYVSEIPGMMHACGHDTHVAMLLGIARRFKAEGVEKGRIKLNFQPGEEGRHGAEGMIAGGIMEDPKVDYAYAQHIWANGPMGTIQIEGGPIMAAVDTVHLKVIGKGTHAAMPEGGHDPIVASAQIVTALQTIVTRNVNPINPAVVTVATINGGTAHNVIPEEVNMTMSVRVFDENEHKTIERRIKEIAGGIAQAMGCRAEIEYIHEHQATDNDPGVAQIVYEEACEIVGKENVIPEQRTMGAEDFSDYLKLVPGAFAFIGARNEAKDCVYPHHHPKFNVDEDAFAIGSELMYRVSQRLLSK